MPDITPVVVILNGQPVSSINPLPTSGGGGGGGGIVEQGKQGSIASPWFVQPTADGATVSLPLPTGAATDAKQDTGNASLASIDGKVATAAAQATGNTSLSSIDTKLTSQATAANQTSGNAALTSILGQLDSKTSTLATATKQDTGNSSLATIATTQADGTQKTQVTSSALPTGAATAAKQPALGTAGTPSADVLSVQGVVGGIAQPISAASLPLPAGAATSALQGGGLPAALVGGRLDVNIGASTSIAVTGPLTDAQLRATPVPVSATITPSGTQDVNLTKVGGSAITLGQKTGANSLPVVLASDTGTLTVATNVTAGSTVGETVVNCSTAQILRRRSRRGYAVSKRTDRRRISRSHHRLQAV